MSNQRQTHTRASDWPCVSLVFCPAECRRFPLRMAESIPRQRPVSNNAVSIVTLRDVPVHCTNRLNYEKPRFSVGHRHTHTHTHRHTHRHTHKDTHTDTHTHTHTHRHKDTHRHTHTHWPGVLHAFEGAGWIVMFGEGSLFSVSVREVSCRVACLECLGELRASESTLHTQRALEILVVCMFC